MEKMNISEIFFFTTEVSDITDTLKKFGHPY